MILDSSKRSETIRFIYALEKDQNLRTIQSIVCNRHDKLLHRTQRHPGRMSNLSGDGERKHRIYAQRGQTMECRERNLIIIIIRSSRKRHKSYYCCSQGSFHPLQKKNSAWQKSASVCVNLPPFLTV